MQTCFQSGLELDHKRVSWGEPPATAGLDPSAGVSMALVIRARDVIMGLSGLAAGGIHVFERAAAGEESVEHADLD